MKAETFIARRYLASTRKSSSVNLLKWIGIVGVALGVASLIVVISVMRGFEKDFQDKIIGFQAPVAIEVPAAEAETLPTLDELRQTLPEIESAERRIEGELVIESEFGTASGARVRGVDIPFKELSGMGNIFMTSPSADDAERGLADLPGIVLGSELAANLQVHPDFDDVVRLVFPFGDVGPGGELLPRIRKFRVIGLFDSGFYEYDNKFAVIAAAQADRLFGPYARVSLALELSDLAAAPRVQKALQERAGDRPWQVTTWQGRNKRLFQALLLERLGMLVLLVMIVLIASFTIFALLSMIVLEKVTDMAVLRSMGLTLQQVRRVFLWQAGRIGVKGTLIGATFGLLICAWLVFFPYRLPASYYIDFLPIAVEPGALALMIAVGPLISLIAGLYPARQATKYGIAEVLRYE